MKISFIVMNEKGQTFGKDDPYGDVYSMIDCPENVMYYSSKNTKKAESDLFYSLGYYDMGEDYFGCVDGDEVEFISTPAIPRPLGRGCGGLNISCRY